MDAIQLLENDHRRVTELFQRFNGGGGLTGLVNRVTGNVSERQRKAAAQQIFKELELHTRVEEEVFYPAVRALGDQELNGMLDEAFREHATVKDEVAVIRRGIGKDPDLQAKMNELQRNVDHHVREEEREMFPRVQAMMDDTRRADVGARIQERKRELGPAAAPARAARTRRPAKQAPARARTTAARRKARPAAAKQTKRRRSVTATAKTRKRAKTGARRRAGRAK